MIRRFFAAFALTVAIASPSWAAVGCVTPFNFCAGCTTEVYLRVKSGKACAIRLNARGGIAGLETVSRPKHGRFGKENETSLAYSSNEGYTGPDSFEGRLYYELSNGKKTFTVLRVRVDVQPKQPKR